MAVTGPWMEEFREQLTTAFGGSVEPVLDLARFDALEARLRGNRLTVDDVVSDLLDGILIGRLVEETDPKRRRYRLTTRHLEVDLHTELSNRGVHEITVLDTAYARRGSLSERYVPVRPGQVRLHRPSDAPPCDLDALIEEADRRRRRMEAERTLSRLRLTPRRQVELRSEVRRRFGSLRALFELIRQQARYGDKATAHGAVIDGATWFGPTHPSAAELVVRLDAVAPFPAGDEAGLLTVWPADSPDSATSLKTAEIVDDVVVLSRPGSRRDAETVRRRLGPGTRVVVSETGEFRYGRHAQALHAFLDERIVGNWTALATLLCHPEDLLHPSHGPAVERAGRPLNQAQREAVAGAIAAPHAFLVQGPPGTGKTQVITEIACRLIALGERVLLTAPTHVALDEVLRRLADEPGVLPLRLSWNDRYVAEDVRRFTLTGYDGAVAGVRTPATSRVPEWQSSRRRVIEQHAALVTWQGLVPRRSQAQESLTAAHETAASRAAQRAHQADTYDAESERWRNMAAFHWSETDRLRAAERAVHLRREVEERARGAFGRLADRLQIGVVARLTRQAQSLNQSTAEAWARYVGAQQRYDRQMADRTPYFAVMAAEERADQSRIASAEQTLAEIERQLTSTAQVLVEHGLDHLRADNHAAVDTIRSLEESRRELEALLDVQQRWFEAIGATGADEAADRDRANEIVRKAVSSAANLICSTTAGFGGAKSFRDLDYDTLVVDEASKVTVAEFLIPAQRARRWILVGDEKQLTPYVDQAVEHHIHAMAAIHLAERAPSYSPRTATKQLASMWHAIDDEEQHPFRTAAVEKVGQRLLSTGTWAEVHRRVYTEQIKHVTGDVSNAERRMLEAMRDHLVTSLFERCVADTSQDTGPRRRLVEQRRMTPEIAELVRFAVYHGDYVSPPATDPGLPRPLLTPSFRKPVVFLDTSSQSRPWDDLPAGTTSFVNHLEAEWVVDVCRTWNDELGHVGAEGRTSISVLAFYGAQARLIRARLGHPRYVRFPNLDFRVVDSIDRIQGQQSDIVIISFCRTYGRPRHSTQRRGSTRTPPPKWAPWLQNINRLNVACTRARRSLVLIGHRPTLRGLNGVPAAEEFYRGLFGLPPNVLEVNVDWTSTRSGS